MRIINVCKLQVTERGKIDLVFEENWPLLLVILSYDNESENIFKNKLLHYCK